MSRQTALLLDSTLSALDPADAIHVERLLKDPEAALASPAPSREDAEELLAMLRVRLAHSERIGHRIVGITAVIDRLQNLPPHTCVLGYGIVSPHAAGNVYFVERGNKAVGATLVER